MKYGKFVGSQSLEFTQDERLALKKHFENLINTHNLPFEVRICRIEDCAIYEGAVKNNVVKVGLYWKNFEELFVNKTLRNKNKCRVSVDDAVTFLVHKSSGYLDETNWLVPRVEDIVRVHNYDDAPEFQYSCHTMSGIHYKKYRGRTWLYLHTHELKVPAYFYGTEFSDFEILEYLNSLIEFIK